MFTESRRREEGLRQFGTIDRCPISVALYLPATNHPRHLRSPLFLFAQLILDILRVADQSLRLRVAVVELGQFASAAGTHSRQSQFLFSGLTLCKIGTMQITRFHRQCSMTSVRVTLIARPLRSSLQGLSWIIIRMQTGGCDRLNCHDLEIRLV